MCSMRPLRSASSCVTTPTYSSGTSIESRSTGSWRLPSISRSEHARLTDRQLEALAAHDLDEHRRAAARRGPAPPTTPADAAGVRCTRSETLPISSASRRVADLARGDLGALAAGQRRGVDAERDRHRGLVDGDHRQRPRVLGVGERLADRDLGDAGHRDDLPRPCLGGVDALERLGDVQLGDLRALDRAVRAAPGDLLAAADRARSAPGRSPGAPRRGRRRGW